MFLHISSLSLLGFKARIMAKFFFDDVESCQDIIELVWA